MIETFYNTDAEKSVLGAVLLKPNEVLDKIDLIHTDFYFTEHRYIIKAIQAIEEKNDAVDIVTITTWLADKNLLSEVGGISYLQQLAEAVPTVENVNFYYEIVRKQAKKRKIQKTLTRMLDKLEEVDDEEELDSLVYKGVDSLNNTGGIKSDGFTHISEVMADVVMHATEDRGEIIGVASGYTELDTMLGGFKGGELVIIGARPSMGKTAFALNLTINAGRAGALVPVYSLEMKNLSLGQRMLSSEAQVNSRNLKIGGSALNGENWDRISHEMGLISRFDILLNDTSGVSVGKIRNDIKRLRKENPDREILCFIDYLQLIQGDKNYNGNRTQELSDISRVLKTTALECNVCIVALSQLSRGVEQRQDKRPMMSDIRESGSIEQDADVIAFLYRDDYYDKESENKNIIECIIAKQRDGSTGTVSLAFIKDYGRFVNLQRRFDG